MCQSKTATTFWLLFLPLLAYQQETNILWFQSLKSTPNYAPSANYFVYHDSEGFVWISSTAGLNRFDGMRVKHYSSNLADSTSLYDDNIQSSIFEDSRKNLWFSTGAIHCYQRKSDNFKQYLPEIKKGTVSSDYRVFFLEKDTFLWFRAGSGIYRFNIFQPDMVADSIATTDADHCTADTATDGSVCFVYGIGGTRLSKNIYWEIENGRLKKQRKWFEKPLSKPTPAVVNKVFSEADSTWLGTDRGLVAWNRKTDRWRVAGGAGYENCSFVPWGKKYLIVWTPAKGLFYFDKATEEFAPLTIETLDGTKVTPESFEQLYLDKDENLWVSFVTSGLMYANLRKTKFKSLPKTQPSGRENSTYSYWSFAEDEAGNFWYGTNPEGLFGLDKKGQLVRHFKHRPGRSSLPNNWVFALEFDEAWNLWVGTQQGLSKFKPANNTFISSISSDVASDSLYIIDLCRLSNGDILASTVGKGIFLIKQNQGRVSLVHTWPDSTSFTTIFEDDSGRIICSKNDEEINLFRLHKDTLRLVDTIPFKGMVFSYYEEPDGKTLWMGTMSGLVKVNLESLTVDTILTEKDGLPDKNIHSMLADAQGNLWLGTPRGLVNFQIKTLKFRTFSRADGALSSEFNIKAALKRRNGELWFGGSDGITIVRPSPFDSVKTKPKVKITGIKINDQERPGLADAKTGATNVTEIDHLDLEFDDNTLSFEFVAIEYSDPANNSLKYKLEGVDDHWVELKKGESGFARYADLRENDYIFKVVATSSEGIESEVTTLLHINIDPPFTRTWSFRILVAIVLGSLTWLILRYRISQIREKAQLNTRVAENKMSALRSQMNPHFIFNSLQTVNGFISRQDLRGAIEYVNQFARLMRVILENSRVNAISLENEIELLELYLQIEAKRFSYPLTYSITVGNELDTYNTEIPPMLLQPFVENAIKHGLFHKKAPGHIAISFQRENGGLKCCVEDNGIGRAKSAELNDQQGRSHKSRGLEIVKERLEIIRASRPGNYNMKTIDLYDLQQNPTGTRVEVILPLT